MPIRVCLAGVTGWTGKLVAKSILQSQDLQLTAVVSRSGAGGDLKELLGTEAGDIKIFNSVEEAIKIPTDVFVDYTSALAVKAHVVSALSKKLCVVIGSSGLTAEDFDEIERKAKFEKVGVVACGNFAITAALAKHFAKIAAEYLPHWEIIDYAHETKMDAPSGTTRELAEALAMVRANQLGLPVSAVVGLKEARGAQISGTPVHSIRLPSFTLGFETIFGMPDERLSIRHEAGTGAGPYVSGTLLAIRKVGQIEGLVQGMDTLLFG